MTRTTVSAGAASYLVSRDVELSYRAIAVGRVASAVPGMPTPAGIAVATPSPGVRAIVRDADFCLAADPGTSIPAATTIDVTISAAGFRPQTTAVTIDPAALPAAIGTIALSPLPVRVQGRVVAADTGDPVASGRVLAIDDPTVGTPPPVHTVALGRPLVRGHSTGAAIEEAPVVSAAGLGPVATDAPAGASALRLAARTGLSAGAVVAIGPVGGDYAEVGRVADPGPPPLADPGSVTLRDPLTQTIRAGSAAYLLTLGNGTATTLAAATEPGGAVVVVDASVGGLVRVDPGPDEEYRFVGVVADGAGFYRLDGLAGVLSLWLAAEAAGFQQAHQALTVRYGTPVTVVDFQLTP